MKVHVVVRYGGLLLEQVLLVEVHLGGSEFLLVVACYRVLGRRSLQELVVDAAGYEAGSSRTGLYLKVPGIRGTCLHISLTGLRMSRRIRAHLIQITHRGSRLTVLRNCLASIDLSSRGRWPNVLIQLPRRYSCHVIRYRTYARSCAVLSGVVMENCLLGSEQVEICGLQVVLIVIIDGSVLVVQLLKVQVVLVVLVDLLVLVVLIDLVGLVDLVVLVGLVILVDLVALDILGTLQIIYLNVFRPQIR